MPSNDNRWRPETRLKLAGKVPWRPAKERSKLMMRPEEVQLTPVQDPLHGSVPVTQALEVVRPDAVQLDDVTADLMERRPLV